MKRLTIGCLFLSGLYSVNSLAAESLPIEETRNPLGCRNVGYQFQLNALRLVTVAKGRMQSPTTPFLEDDPAHPIAPASDHQSLYFVLNQSNKPIHLYQMHADESSRSTYLNHTIQAKQWAVLATNETSVVYSCTVDQAKNTYGQIVACGDYLRVCEYTKVRFGLNNRGNFWINNSNTRGGAVGDVVRYGIIPQ